MRLAKKHKQLKIYYNLIEKTHEIAVRSLTNGFVDPESGMSLGKANQLNTYIKARMHRNIFNELRSSEARNEHE